MAGTDAADDASTAAARGNEPPAVGPVDAGSQGRVMLKLGIVQLVTAVMIALTHLHARGVNGAWYWNWSWRRLPALPLYVTMLLAALPLFIALVLAERRRVQPGLALALIMLSTFGLQLAAIREQPPYGLSRVTAIVQNAINTSYFTSATFVQDLPVDGWLPVYHEILPQVMIHARFKPPGLMMYYYVIIQLFGTGPGAALIGGLLIGVLATLAVPATYWLIRFYTAGNASAALHGAAFIALCPSLVLFLPQFDQVYPALACVLLVAWGKALNRGDYRWSVAFGAALALALFLSYIFLILGLFLAVQSILHMGERRGRGVWRVVLQSSTAIVTLVLCYLVLYRSTGFDPLLTFNTIAALQASDLVYLARPWPLHMIVDFYDFALGAGWISYALVAIYLAREGRGVVGIFGQSSEHRLVFLSLLQILTVAGTALLPGESARLWLPMLPLLMAPIGLELARWPLGARLIAYACLWLILVTICQNMTFIYMGPELDGPRS